MYVFSYPRGGGLAIAFDDNEVLDPQRLQSGFSSFNAQTHRIYHRAPTEGGSSGGPVFNQNWELVGIHEGGSHHTSSNFGVCLEPILKDMQTRLATVSSAEGA